MSKETCDQAYGYWVTGSQYIELVKNIINETIQQGNQHVLVSAEEISEEAYAQKTKWSDHNIIIPTLFDLFHGFELFLKGFLIAIGEPQKSSHKLSELLDVFNEKFNSNGISSIMEKYIQTDKLPKLLSEFCNASNITIDDYYQALKYPESNKGEIYKHRPLKYKGEAGLPFFSELSSDLEPFIAEAVKLSTAICSSVQEEP